MKRTTIAHPALLIASATIIGASSAVAEQNRFYLKADAGLTSADDVELRSYFGQPIAANSEISLDPGVRLGVAFGYGLTDWLAAEVETGFSANSIDDITAGSSTDGSITHVPILFNAKVHLPDTARVSPYIGAGLGLANTILVADDITVNHGGGSTTFDGVSSDTVFAWQAFVGVNFAINDRMSVGGEYRYFYADPANLSADEVSSGVPSDRLRLGEAEIHSLSVTFTLKF